LGLFYPNCIFIDEKDKKIGTKQNKKKHTTSTEQELHPLRHPLLCLPMDIANVYRIYFLENMPCMEKEVSLMKKYFFNNLTASVSVRAPTLKSATRTNFCEVMEKQNSH